MTTERAAFVGTLTFNVAGTPVPIVTDISIPYTMQGIGSLPVPAETSPCSSWQISPDAMSTISAYRIVNKTGRVISIADNDDQRIPLADGGSRTYATEHAEDLWCPIQYVYAYLSYEDQLRDGSIEFEFFGEP